MKEISQPYHSDILIVGGRSAGCAALAASRQGVKVLILEEENCLGGTATAGGVNDLYANFEGLDDVFLRVWMNLQNDSPLINIDRLITGYSSYKFRPVEKKGKYHKNSRINLRMKIILKANIRSNFHPDPCK